MGNITDSLLGPSEPKRASEDQLSYDPDRKAGFGMQAAASFASDENEMIRYFAQELFPDEPIDQAATRFGKTASGVLYFRDSDDRVKRVYPNEGVSRLHNVGSGVGALLPVATGTATGIATAPLAATGVGLGATLAATGAAAGGGDVARQWIGDRILGEASTDDINPYSAAYEAGTAATGQGIGTGIARLGRGARVQDIDQFSAAETGERYARARRQGQKLTPAEATGLNSLKAQQARISNDVPASANIMQQFSERRAGDVTGRMRQFLDDLAPSGDAEEIGRQARRVAEGSVRKADRARSDAAKPHYKRAGATGFNVDVSDIAGELDNVRQFAKGKVARDVKRARDMLNFKGTDQLDDTIAGLHGTKVALDEMIEQSGDNAVGRTAKGALIRARNALAERLKQESADYLRGATEFKRMSPAYDELFDGAVGALSRTKDPQLHNAALKMFSPSNTTPKAIARVRRAFLGQGAEGRDAWNKLQRLYLQQRIYGALKETEKGEIANVPGKIQKLFGSLSGERQVMKAAMDPDAYAEFDEMIKVFRDMASAVNTNSDTAWKQAAQAAAKNKATPLWARALSNVNPAAALRNVREWAAGANYEKDAVRLAQIFSRGDPQALRMLRELRKLPPKHRPILLGHLLTQGGSLAASQAVD